MLYTTQSERGETQEYIKNKEQEHARASQEREEQAKAKPFHCDVPAQFFCGKCCVMSFDEPRVSFPSAAFYGHYHVQCFVEVLHQEQNARDDDDTESKSKSKKFPRISSIDDFGGIENLPPSERANLMTSVQIYLARAGTHVNTSNKKEPASQAAKTEATKNDNDGATASSGDREKEEKENSDNQNQQQSEKSTSFKFQLPDLVVFTEDAEKISTADKALKTPEGFKSMLLRGEFAYLEDLEKEIKKEESKQYLDQLDDNDNEDDDQNKKSSSSLVSLQFLSDAVERHILTPKLAFKVTTGPMVTEVNPLHFAAMIGFLEYLQRLFKLLTHHLANKLNDVEVELEQVQDGDENDNDEDDTKAKPISLQKQKRNLSSPQEHPLFKKVFELTKADCGRSLSEFPCRGGHLHVIKFLRENNLFHVFQKNEGNVSPLYLFVQSNDKPEILEYLRQNIPGMKEHFFTYTARDNRENYLHVAVRKNRKKTVRYFVEQIGLDVNSKMDDSGKDGSVFAVACRYGKDDEIVRYLFEKGGAQNCLDELNESIKKVNCVIRRMEDDEPLPNDNDGDGDDTDVGEKEYFVKPTYFPVMRLSNARKMEKEAKTRKDNNNNNSKSLDPASSAQEEEKYQQQQQQQQEKKTKSSSSTAVNNHETDSSSNKHVLSQDRRYVIIAKKKRYKTNSPLSQACENKEGGAVAIAKFLCEEAGFDGDKNRHLSVSTPVYLAACQGNFEVLEYLLKERKADPDAKDDTGCTPLYAASWYNEVKCVELLLQCGANSSILYKGENSPAVAATNNQSFEALKALARGGGDVTTPPGGYSNVMEYARELGHHEIANWLMEFGAM